jgi:hypothetical protein
LLLEVTASNSALREVSEGGLMVRSFCPSLSIKPASAPKVSRHNAPDNSPELD